LASRLFARIGETYPNRRLLVIWSEKMSSWIGRISRPLPQAATIFQSRRNPAAFRRSCQVAPLVLALALAGCGSGSSSNNSGPAGLQPPPAAGPYNSYIGTSPLVYRSGQSGSGNAYGIWSASFDHTAASGHTDTFSAWDVTTTSNNTDPNVPRINGTFAASGGFLALTQTNDPPLAPAGFALEIPGRVAILRQGDTTVPVTAMIPVGCPGINGDTKFNFVVVLPAADPNYTPPWNPATDAAYGSLVIASSGSIWNLTSYQLSTLAGAAAPNNGASLPPGTCAPTAGGNAVFVPSDPALNLPQTIAVGPSGFYIADQGLVANGVGNPGEFGVIQPSAPLATSDVLSHKYLGFIYESGAGALTPVIPESQLAAFSASTPAGQLVGGAFANDDPTQPAAANLVIDLGKEDAKTNGLYPSVVITNQDSGTPYPAVAVVGNPESKYAVFIIGEDMDNSVPIGIYLFQR